jgi:hypothetical protein
LKDQIPNSDDEVAALRCRFLLGLTELRGRKR